MATLESSVEQSRSETHIENENDVETDNLTATKNTTRTEYPLAIGRKFHPNGSVRPFRGNTILCHLPPDSALQRPLVALYKDLDSSKFASFFTLLPPPSWHMTVFDCVCDQVRGSDFWPSDLPLDTEQASCDAIFRHKLVDFDLGNEPPFSMVVDGWKPFTIGIVLRLVPVNSEEEERMRSLRDRLSKLLQVRQPGHDTYVFHITFAYLLRHLNQEQTQDVSTFLNSYLREMSGVFTFGVPEFCLFDDMFAFHRQFFLG